MAEPTLQEVFGADASQDADYLTIPKSIFAEFGLPSDFDNNPEALLFGMLLYASKTLTESNRLNDRVNRQITITQSPFDVLEDPPGSNAYYRRDILTAIAYTPQVATPPNLANY